MQWVMLAAVAAVTALPLRNRTDTHLPSTSSNSPQERNATQSPQEYFNFYQLVKLRENDWRDSDGSKRMIIWSHESKHHPDYGKIVARVGETADRVGRSSRMMSFVILGSVIGFILYTYISHVILMRRLRRENEAMQLKQLLHRTALIMASSAAPNRSVRDFPVRRHSILNMFRGFKL